MHLVTGGAGFIGSHLVDALVSIGKSVRVLDHLGARPGEDGSRQRNRFKRFGRAVECQEGDVRDPASVRKALDGVQRVYHLAHYTGTRASMSQAVECLETNVLGTQVLLQEMTTARVDHLILSSHGSVYGPAGPEPSRESDPLAPHSPFAASMVSAEALTRAWQAHTEGRLAIVRPFTVYGPRMRPDSAVHLFMSAMQKGFEVPIFGKGASRDLVYAGDVVRVLVEARRANQTTRPAIFNVAWGEAIPLMEVVRAIEVLAGTRARVAMLPAQTGEIQSAWGDPSHTAQILGIEPRTSLEQGLRRTWKWMQAANGG